MNRISRKFSPNEQRALEFARIKHKGAKRIGGRFTRDAVKVLTKVKGARYSF